MTDKQILILDFVPPTVNHIWKHRVIGKFASVYMSKEGKEFKAKVANEAAQQITHKMKGELEVTIELTFGDKRAHDIDNYNKGLLDALTGILWNDDSQIKIMHCFLKYQPHQNKTYLSVKEVIPL